MNDSLLFEPEKLDERAVYRVTVMAQDRNPPHGAILLTGFKSGSYAKIVGPSFHEYHPTECYRIEVHEKLCDLPSHGAFEDAEHLTDDWFFGALEDPDEEFPPSTDDNQTHAH